MAALVVVLLVAGGGALWSALRHDGGTYPGAAWRGQPQFPRSARVDPFEGTGPLGVVDGFGTWSDPGGDWQRRNGWAGFDSDGEGVATVDAGAADVLVMARFARAEPGTGVVLSAPDGGVGGLWLVVNDAGNGWDLVLQGPQGPDVLQSFPTPTRQVVVEVVRQGARAAVRFDTTRYAVTVPDSTRAGSFVGLVGSGTGNRVDGFGYLPLAAG